MVGVLEMDREWLFGFCLFGGLVGVVKLIRDGWIEWCTFLIVFFLFFFFQESVKDTCLHMENRFIISNI